MTELSGGRDVVWVSTAAESYSYHYVINECHIIKGCYFRFVKSATTILKPPIMAEYIIEHPMRTIRMAYDAEAGLTEQDKEFVARYVAVHDAFHALRQQRGKLRFDYMEVADTVAHVEEMFAQLAEPMNALVAEADVLVEKVRRVDALNDLLERMDDMNEPLEDFHEGHLMPLSEAMDALDAPWEAYEGAEDAFDTLFEAFDNEMERPFMKESYPSTLEFFSYYDDMEELKGYFDKVFMRNDEDQVVERYSALVNNVNSLYARWNKAQENITRVFANDAMLDRSLSEACGRGEVPKALQPLYLVDPKHEMVSRFASTYGLLAHNANHTLAIQVPSEAVTNNDHAMFQELIMALQHYPALMEKMLWSIDFNFQYEFGGTMTEDQWKGQEPTMRWIHGFSTIKPVYFFLKDRDARHYFLMGDLIFDKALETMEDGEVVKMEGEALKILLARVFDVGCFFMLFCHNTGIDPTPHIERMLHEMQLPITIDLIREEYEELVAKDIHLTIVPVAKK